MTAEQRPCPSCGTTFTWTSAAPRQRFCSTRCKHQWWCDRRRQATAALSGTTAAVPACPHCARPVAIVAWLVPPTAANVTTPPRHAATISDNQQRTR